VSPCRGERDRALSSDAYHALAPASRLISASSREGTWLDPTTTSLSACLLKTTGVGVAYCSQSAAEQSELDALTEDLEYCTNFPRGEKYVALFPVAGSQEDQAELEQKRATLRLRIKRQLAAKEAGEADLALLMEADEGLGARSPRPAKAKQPKVAVAPKAALGQPSSAPAAAKKGLLATGPTVAPAKRSRQDESGSDDEEEENGDGTSTWTSGASVCSLLPTLSHRCSELPFAADFSSVRRAARTGDGFQC